MGVGTGGDVKELLSTLQETQHPRLKLGMAAYCPYPYVSHWLFE